MIDLYYWTTPNGHKVTIFLEETATAYKLIPVNIGKGEQFKAQFLAVSPNNRIPAAIDHAPAGGGPPIAVFESGAILLYLADKTGQFLSRDLAGSVGTNAGNSTQTAIGADAEYSRDYYLIRFEAVRSTWTLPTIHEPLVATGGWIEGRYKIHPRLYAAARFDHLGFSTIAGTTRTIAWDAPVTRVEVGGGYLLQRNLQVKASFQRNTREGGRVTHLKIGSVQVVFWF
jgi:hypothetical protein